MEYISWLFILSAWVIFAIWLAPVIIAFRRDHKNKVVILALSFFTSMIPYPLALFACWIVLLAWSLYKVSVVNDGSKSAYLEYAKGPQGLPGPMGPRGESAYETYLRVLRQEDPGTIPLNEKDWLASLKGPYGDKGDAGPSAYDLYCLSVWSKGVGKVPLSLDEWLESLRGKDADELPLSKKGVVSPPKRP
ncbi:hypothetical protein A54_252 [Septuagintavirus sv54]|uniref:Uncharacterized protein n=1 Tax=Escherichia phage A5-4 TaxID=2996162 RepID=A0AAE9PSH2_9CAUD|nr:hypothetical protein A54_252 [Escherichia phage A5-4]